VDGARRLGRGERAEWRDLLLTPANMRRVADSLARMRGGEPYKLRIEGTDELKVVASSQGIFYAAPAPGKNDFVEFLMPRAEAHMKKRNRFQSVWRLAAEMLFDDRHLADRAGHPKPGQAEYLDLLSAADALEPGNEEKQKALIRELKEYTYRKNLWSAS